jgi:tetratricopeptide (TPR) repeat protein
MAQLAGEHGKAVQHFADAYRAHRRAGGESTFGEMPLLRLWLASAAAAADRAAGAEPAQVLEHLQPGYPLSLLARARYLAAVGDAAEAAVLLENALTLWADAESGYPPREEARTLRLQLAADGKG